MGTKENGEHEEIKYSGVRAMPFVIGTRETYRTAPFPDIFRLRKKPVNQLLLPSSFPLKSSHVAFTMILFSSLSLLLVS